MFYSGKSHLGSEPNFMCVQEGKKMGWGSKVESAIKRCDVFASHKVGRRSKNVYMYRSHKKLNNAGGFRSRC